MSFASEVRMALAQLPAGKPCCMRAELAAMVQTGGAVVLRGGGGYALNMATDSPSVARRCFLLFKRVHNAAPEVRVAQGHGVGRARRITLVTEGHARAVLEGALLTGASGAPMLSRGVPMPLLRRDCCKRAYLRGAFLMGGTANEPRKGYLIEFYLSGIKQARGIARLLASYGVPAGEGGRREGVCVYIKDSEGVSTLFALMGAGSAMMQVENTRIVKGMRNDVNRAINCETANMDKAVGAAQRQLEAIRALEASGRFPRLPPELRAAAEQRLLNPELPLSDLAAGMTPPVSKSTLHHRLKRLMELAEQ